MNWGHKNDYNLAWINFSPLYPIQKGLSILTKMHYWTQVVPLLDMVWALDKYHNAITCCYLLYTTSEQD